MTGLYCFVGEIENLYGHMGGEQFSDWSLFKWKKLRMKESTCENNVMVLLFQKTVIEFNSIVKVKI